MTTEQWWTVAELATHLKVHVNTVRAWIQRGDLKAAKTPGNHLRIPQSEVDRITEDA